MGIGEQFEFEKTGRIEKESMNTSTHTPGPWEAYYVQSGGWSVRMAKPREGYDRPDPICSMSWWQFDKPGIIDDNISGANAKLIAAAPDLLTACLDTISKIEDCDDGKINFRRDFADRLKEAVAKALS